MNINCCVVSSVFFNRMKYIVIDNYDLTAENDKLKMTNCIAIKTAKF